MLSHEYTEWIISVEDERMLPGMVTANPTGTILSIAEEAAKKILSLSNSTNSKRYSLCDGLASPRVYNLGKSVSRLSQAGESNKENVELHFLVFGPHSIMCVTV